MVSRSLFIMFFTPIKLDNKISYISLHRETKLKQLRNLEPSDNSYANVYSQPLFLYFGDAILLSEEQQASQFHRILGVDSNVVTKKNQKPKPKNPTSPRPKLHNKPPLSSSKSNSIGSLEQNELRLRP